MRPTTVSLIPFPIIPGEDEMCPATHNVRSRHDYYPSGIAVGGKAAGTYLPAAPGKKQAVNIMQPLPDTFENYTEIAKVVYEREVYEFSQLRVDEHSFISFWKVSGLTECETLEELFRGYVYGKEAEARQRKALQKSR
jgi:hypothetical protein